MPKNTRLLIDRDRIKSPSSFDDAPEAAREAFRLRGLGEGRVFPVVREKLASGAVFGVKSGGVETQEIPGSKAAGFWPGNLDRMAVAAARRLRFTQTRQFNDLQETKPCRHSPRTMTFALPREDLRDMPTGRRS
jgi:hypothetical protein